MALPKKSFVCDFQGESQKILRLPDARNCLLCGVSYRQTDRHPNLVGPKLNLNLLKLNYCLSAFQSYHNFSVGQLNMKLQIILCWIFNPMGISILQSIFYLKEIERMSCPSLAALGHLFPLHYAKFTIVGWSG